MIVVVYNCECMVHCKESISLSLLSNPLITLIIRTLCSYENSYLKSCYLKSSYIESCSPTFTKLTLAFVRIEHACLRLKVRF